MTTQDFNQKETAFKFLGSIFSITDQETINAITEAAVFEEIKKDSYLIEQGKIENTAYLLLDGSVDVSMNLNEKTIDLGSMEPGVLIGEIALVLETARTVNIKAGTDLAVMKIDQEIFNTVIMQNADALRAMLKNNLLRIQDVTTKITQLFAATEEIQEGKFDPKKIENISGKNDEISKLAKSIINLSSFCDNFF